MTSYDFFKHGKWIFADNWYSVMMEIGRLMCGDVGQGRFSHAGKVGNGYVIRDLPTIVLFGRVRCVGWRDCSALRNAPNMKEIFQTLKKRLIDTI